jgi:hypothetical protein
MKKVLTTVVFLITVFGVSYCQINADEIIIKNWLKNKSNEDTILSFRVYGLQNSFDYPFKNKTLKLHEGIYGLKEIKSHSIPYLLLVENDTGINFVENYDADSLLKIYNERKCFLKSTAKKLHFLEKLFNFMIERERLFKSLSN